MPVHLSGVFYYEDSELGFFKAVQWKYVFIFCQAQSIYRHVDLFF